MGYVSSTPCTNLRLRRFQESFMNGRGRNVDLYGGWKYGTHGVKHAVTVGVGP
jgi:hypothetical protein